MYDWKHKILLGHIVADAPEPLKIIIEDDQLKRYMGQPWMRDYILQHDDIDINQRPMSGAQAGTPVEVETGLLNQHGLILGTTGSGKTTAALNILHEQLRAGASAVIVDVKDETIQQCIAVAQKAGLRKEQITVVWPREKRTGVPGWNPLTQDGDVEDNVADFIDIILQGESGGLTYGPALKRAATIMATLGLSLQEELWFFQDATYRAAILKKVATDPKLAHLRRHIDFFTNMEESNKGKMPDSVLNKIERFEDISFFNMFTANSNTLRLADLWTSQRIVLVHLGMRTEDENRMLSSLITNQLNRISERVGGNWKRPVILMLDELRDHARMIKDLIISVQSKGRSRGLWLLAATQTLSLVPPEIQDALGSLTALKLLMRVRPDEASDLKDYVPEKPSEPKTISVSLAKVTRDGPELCTAKGCIVYLDGWVGSNGKYYDMYPDVEMPRSKWEAISECLRRDIYPNWLEAISEWWAATEHRHKSLWVRYENDEDTYDTQVEEMLNQCYSSTLSWDQGKLYLTFTFPKPKAIVKERTAPAERGKSLARIPDFHGYVFVKTDALGLVKTPRFDLPRLLPDPLAYLGTGQSESEIKQVAETRQKMKEQLLRPPVVQQERTQPKPREVKSWEELRLIPLGETGIYHTEDTYYTRKEDGTIISSWTEQGYKRYLKRRDEQDKEFEKQEEEWQGYLATLSPEQQERKINREHLGAILNKRKDGSDWFEPTEEGLAELKYYAELTESLPIDPWDSETKKKAAPKQQNKPTTKKQAPPKIQPEQKKAEEKKPERKIELEVYEDGSL